MDLRNADIGPNLSEVGFADFLKTKGKRRFVASTAPLVYRMDEAKVSQDSDGVRAVVDGGEAGAAVDDSSRHMTALE